MDPNRIRAFARSFPENGMRVLLEDPSNGRDRRRLAGHNGAGAIELERLALVKETFVRRDYRDVEGDIVLTAPRRGESGRGRRSGPTSSSRTSPSPTP